MKQELELRCANRVLFSPEFQHVINPENSQFNQKKDGQRNQDIMS